MIPPYKLTKLHPRQRVRKAALLLQEVEGLLRMAGSRETAAPAGNGPAPAGAAEALAYAASLARFLAGDEELPPAVREAAAKAFPGALIPDPADPADPADPIRAVNSLRHLLLRESGQAPADWDFFDPLSGRPDPSARGVLPGTRAYLEDIRSPFNVGSMFRTSDAFGLEELILSPGTADPGHPRAERSAMGATGLLAWRRAGLEALEEAARAGEAVFALELGGEAIGSFDFPERGIVVLGSEELGVSTEALDLCTAGKVSIPMSGAKGSLNVGVAYGILLCAWSSHIGP
jgi:TrmH family RNA methyltransferase